MGRTQIKSYKRGKIPKQFIKWEGVRKYDKVMQIRFEKLRQKKLEKKLPLKEQIRLGKKREKEGRLGKKRHQPDLVRVVIKIDAHIRIVGEKKVDVKAHLRELACGNTAVIGDEQFLTVPV